MSLAESGLWGHEGPMSAPHVTLTTSAPTGNLSVSRSTLLASARASLFVTAVTVNVLLPGTSTVHGTGRSASTRRSRFGLGVTRPG